MNKRIKELAADAGYPDYMTYGQDKVLERFAKLIVLECSIIVGSMEEPHQDIAKLVKEHFGFEE